MMDHLPIHPIAVSIPVYEAGSQHLSKWEVNCFDGFTINNPKGGSKEERTYNVDACVKLFDSMIDSIEGGSIGGSDADAKNSEHLEKIPDAIKTQIIAFVMNEITTNSGNYSKPSKNIRLIE